MSEEYWSALFGVGIKREVGFLDEEAAQQLISQPLAGQAEYSEEAIIRILQLTASNPYFVQMVCHNIVNVLNEQSSTYVSSSIVEEAAQETLISADGHFITIFQSASTSIHRALVILLASNITAGSVKEDLTLPKYEVEKFIDDYHLPIEHHELEDVLRELSERDIISIHGEMGKRFYGFKIDLVRQWIRRNYDLQSAIKIAQSTPYTREP